MDLKRTRSAPLLVEVSATYCRAPQDQNELTRWQRETTRVIAGSRLRMLLGLMLPCILRLHWDVFSRYGSLACTAEPVWLRNILRWRILGNSTWAGY